MTPAIESFKTLCKWFAIVAVVAVIMRLAPDTAFSESLQALRNASPPSGTVSDTKKAGQITSSHSIAPEYLHQGSNGGGVQHEAGALVSSQPMMKQHGPSAAPSPLPTVSHNTTTPYLRTDVEHGSGDLARSSGSSVSVSAEPQSWWKLAAKRIPFMQQPR